MKSKIISLQIALETICWTYLIEENDLIEENSFDKLQFSDKLRLLLYEFKIDKSFSDNDFFELEYIRNKFKDGPHLITEVRNSIIHPTTKEKIKI
ncbi:hypothetical protein HMSSN036_79330 [Paenibacillus macerans]|nr:hypothetical protein HMSSN036_79330 [Paenibacillus macerans]